ncbi:MAG: CvpA family protein [Pirellulales bacterium]
MAWILNLCLVIVFLVCVLMSLASGLWGNLIMIFNVMLAALIATNYFEPLAGWLDGQMPSYTFFWDFLAMWGIFALSVVVLRAITDTLSRVKVRFKKPLEVAGGLVCGAVVGWLMVCFTLFSLHTAPLAHIFLRGGFSPGTNMFFGMAPDRIWGRFAAGQSDSEGGALTAGEEFSLYSYMERYATRRAAFEMEPEMRTKK